MSKKMKTPSIFKTKEAKQPWQWPSCKNLKTLSFQASDDSVFKTINSVFLDIETPKSLLITSSECTSFSTEQSSDESNCNLKSDHDSLEMIIQRVRSSERLFFEPGGTSSIMKEEKTSGATDEVLLPFEESFALAMESDDPYLDFKKSMLEMVESHGLRDWESLEELLGWYLQMNGKMHHGFIVRAFVDLLIELASNSTSTTIYCSDSTRYSSAGSSLSSPSSSTSSTVVVGHEIKVAQEYEELNIVQC